jgi:hypothetical protein
MAKLLVSGSLAKDVENLNKSILKLEKISLKSLKTIILNASESFLISASKATPPKGVIPVKRYNNAMIRGGKKRGAGWKVFYPKRAQQSFGRRMNAKWFKKKADAKKFAKIEYRGISKAGWFLNLPDAGFKLKKAHRDILKRSPRVLYKANQVHAFSMNKKKEGWSVRFSNRVDNISRYGWIAQRVGYQMAEKRINLEKNQIHRDLYKSWQA